MLKTSRRYTLPITNIIECESFKRLLNYKMDFKTKNGKAEELYNYNFATQIVKDVLRK